MSRINVHDAETNLSRYLRRVERGEVFTICRDNVPIAELRAVPFVRRAPRTLGLHKGRVSIDATFFEPLDDADLAPWSGE